MSSELNSYKTKKSTVIFTFSTSFVFSAFGILGYIAVKDTVFIFLGIVFIAVGTWQARKNIIVMNELFFELNSRMIGQPTYIQYNSILSCELKGKRKPIVRYVEDGKEKIIKLPYSLLGEKAVEEIFNFLNEKIKQQV